MDFVPRAAELAYPELRSNCLSGGSWLAPGSRQGTERMAKIKLTKTVADAATFGTKEYELRDTVVPGLLLKVTRVGRKIFMLQYRTNAGNRRKPAIGRFGELTV